MVTDADLHERRPGLLELAHHLHADDPARRGEFDAIEERPSDETEIAVGVAHLQAEQDPHHVVVGAPDHLAVPGIAASHLPSLHDIGRVGRRIDASDEFGGVVLGVAVGVEDPLFRRGGETGDERPAVPSIGLVAHDAQFGDDVLELLEHPQRLVCRSVVDDDDLEVRDAADQCVASVEHHGRDRVLIVEAREECRHRHHRRVGDGHGAGRWSRTHGAMPMPNQPRSSRVAGGAIQASGSRPIRSRSARSAASRSSSPN